MSFSRFRLADLQVHTIADKHHSYGQWQSEGDEFAQQLVQSLVDAGVTVIALTDHLRVDWWPAIQAAAEPVGLTVFPGFEVSAEGCHLIAIFESSQHGYQTAEHFLKQQLPAGQGPLDEQGNYRTLTKTAIDFAQHAVDAGALVIAPHSTKEKMGLFGKQVVRNKSELVQSGLVAAYDIWGSAQNEALTSPNQYFGQRRPTWIVTGDMRTFDEAGKRAVHLKVDEPVTLEGLRQALLMPDQRVRIPTRFQGAYGATKGARFCDVGEPTWPRIESVKVEGGFLDGLDVALGPGLNAIIGGKGTGKSAIVEGLRYALGQPDPVNTDLVRNRKRNIPANTDVTVGIVTDEGARYQAVRSGSDSSPKLLSGGKQIEVAVDRRFEVRVFGQHDLRSLATEDPLRDFLAAEADADWQEAAAEEQSALDELNRLSTQLAGIEADAERLASLRAELADLSERLDRAREGGAEQLLARLEALTRDDRAVRDAAAWPVKVQGAVTNLSSLLPRPELPTERGPNPGDDGQDSGSEGAADQIADLLDLLAEQASAAADQLGDTASRTVESLRPLVQAWEAAVSDEQGSIAGSLQDLGVPDATALAEDQSKATQLEAQIRGFSGADQPQDQIESARSVQLERLAAARRKRSRAISRSADELNGKLGKRVQVEVEPLAEREALVEAIRRIASGAQAPAIERAVRDRTPAEVVAAARAGAKALEGLGFSERAVTGLAAASPADLRQIEQVDTPDRVRLLMNVADEADPVWRPVDDCSPGQKATAVLTLALVGGTAPLIIDQPEDDLDNRFIYDTVVKTVCDVCEGRQVIVATHNANIPVLGDAECVVALDATSDKATVQAHGGLEKPEVSRLARDILEGGDSAFRARQDRYRAGQ